MQESYREIRTPFRLEETRSKFCQNEIDCLFISSVNLTCWFFIGYQYISIVYYLYIFFLIFLKRTFFNTKSYLKYTCKIYTCVYIKLLP